MRSTKVARVVFGLAYIALVIALAVTYPSLPQRVASHFDAQGVPDGWMPRRSYTLFMAMVGLGVPWLIVALTRLVRTLPVSLVNLPNRKYWLAPERREEVYRTTETAGLWLAIGEVLLFTLLHLCVVHANQLDPIRLPMALVWAGLTGFLLMIAVGLVAFYLRFRKIPEAA